MCFEGLDRLFRSDRGAGDTLRLDTTTPVVAGLGALGSAATWDQFPSPAGYIRGLILVLRQS